MLKFLSPGDLLSDAVGLPEGENRVIFRMLINTMVWTAIGCGLVPQTEHFRNINRHPVITSPKS